MIRGPSPAPVRRGGACVDFPDAAAPRRTARRYSQTSTLAILALASSERPQLSAPRRTRSM